MKRLWRDGWLIAMLFLWGVDEWLMWRHQRMIRRFDRRG